MKRKKSPQIVAARSIVKTPGGKNEADTFFSTNTANSPMQIIERFVLRWNSFIT